MIENCCVYQYFVCHKWSHCNLKSMLKQSFVFKKDLTIQVDPNATGVLKLPNLLDIMSKIVDDENHDGQIMDAFRYQSLPLSLPMSASAALTRMGLGHWQDLIWSWCFRYSFLHIISVLN